MNTQFLHRAVVFVSGQGDYLATPVFGCTGGCHQGDLPCDCKPKQYYVPRRPEYNSWRSMKSRCLVPTSPDFHRYGAKGVTICDRWKNDFSTFLADMGPRPPGKSLDRFPDRDGNYEPGNCRWATPVEQTRNRRWTVEVVYHGIKQPLQAWCDQLGLAYTCAMSRLKAGKPLDIVMSPKPFRNRRQGVKK